MSKIVFPNRMKGRLLALTACSLWLASTWAPSALAVDAGASPAATTGSNLPEPAPNLIKQTPQAAPAPTTEAPLPTPAAQAAGTTAPAGTSVSMASPPSSKSNAGPLPAPDSKTSTAPAPGGTPVADNYPSVGKMETLTFGTAQPQLPIEERLTLLENQVFKKTFTDRTLFDRTEQLKVTLLGSEDETPAERTRFMQSDLLLQPGVNIDANYFDDLADRPENQQTISIEELEQDALDLINAERQKLGVPPVAHDDLAQSIAHDQVADLCKRNLISHANAGGDNPDRRYTLAGGNDVVAESVVTVKTPDSTLQSATKAAVIRVVQTIFSRQDDRDAIMSADATHMGFALNWAPFKDHLIACTEVVTKHGVIHPLEAEAHVGDKIEVKGVVLQPYKFDRVTIAWEANRSLGAAADETDEALPYFPPLDYVAYANKSDKDYSGALMALRTVGVVAAIAGGMFIPPVALAAPLIALSGSGVGGDPKPASDIPVHSGVKLEGQTFMAKVPLSKENKEGMYYVTVWASIGDMQKPIPISRRAILTKGFDESVAAQIDAVDGKKHKSSKNE